MKLLKLAASAAAIALLSSCNGDPFALNLQKVDETSDPAPATIELSAPQLYSRERLINDRASEEVYLQTLLEQSVNIPFTPALRRDLNSITSLFLSLQASFNPVAGAQSRRSEDVNDMKLELDKANFDIQLAKLRQQLADFEASHKTEDAPGVASTTTDANGAATTLPVFQTPGQTETPVTTPQNPTADALATQLAAINSALTGLQNAVKDISATSSTKAAAAEVQATPQEVFEDRQAYRTELRSALEQSRLDDRHDLNGNTLYRLQYHATVLPGKVKNRYGVAEVTIKPPMLSNEDVYNLYRDWLAAITADLNQAGPDGQLALRRYSALGSATGLFQIDMVPFGEANCAVARGTGAMADPDKCALVPIALPANLAAQVTKFFKKATAWDARFTALDKFYTNVRTETSTPPAISSKLILTPPQDKTDCSNSFRDSAAGKQPFTNLLSSAGVTIAGPPDAITLTDMADQAQRAIALQQITALAFTKAGMATLPAIAARDAADGNHVASDDFNKTTGALGRWSSAAYNFFDLVDMVNRNDLGKRLAEAKDPETRASIKATACKSYLRRGFAPATFYNAVKGRDAKVDTFAYSTGPDVFAQRVSTIANATEAVQVLAALSAALPNSGVSVDAAANYMHSATGKIQALESVPLVMGFSGAEQIDRNTNQIVPANSQDDTDYAARFGWVFGPKAIVNAAEHTIELRQVPFNEGVTADVSVPGWWPSLRLEVRTAWIKNFHEGLIEPNPVEEPRIVEVPLSSTRQRLDSLTEFLSNSAWGQQPSPMAITSIEPTTISACATSSVIIRGPNLWRGGEVYLNGRKSDGPIHVLPDMQGIVANFKLDASSGGVAKPGLLQVFTQVGTDSETLNLDPTGCNSNLLGTGVVPVVTTRSLAVWPSTIIELNASAEWPDPSKLSIRLFPQGAPNSSTLVEMASVSRTGLMLRAAFPATLPAAVAALPNGAALEGSVLYSDAGQKRAIAAISPLYLFQSEADSQLTIATAKPTTVTKAQLDAASNVNIMVKLSFPENFQAAYPDLVAKGLRLVLRDSAENETQSVKVIPPADGASRDLVQVVPLDKAKAAAVLGAQNSATMKFKLVAGDQANATDITVPDTPTLTVNK